MAWRETLARGAVVPAHPLALTADRKLDERRQRALTRYYIDAGAGGVAVGVHTTQFAIREAGLLQPVLEIAAQQSAPEDFIRVAGVCGPTTQAVKEAELASGLGYHAALLSLSALARSTVPELLAHARSVSGIMPLFGFYLQPAVGGRVLTYDFWRAFCEIPNVVAIKIAPFNRYQTIDVMRALSASGRESEIALYTGNDDHIVLDLLHPKFRGGLLGHWAVWTKKAVELLQAIQCRRPERTVADWFCLADQITDANAALFDVANRFRGCIAGINEVLRRQGLLAGRWCLDPDEDLSPGQLEEIDRVYAAYPHLDDDEFVRENLDRWLS